jgi:hypothetical protein
VAIRRVRRRVDQQVPTGDAEVEVAGRDVGRDVARAQVEELQVVVGVPADQVAVVGPLAVTGLAQHLGGRTGQGAFVGNGYTQHGTCSYPKPGTQPEPIFGVGEHG